MPSCREGLTGNTDAVFMVFEDAELSVNYLLLKANMNTVPGFIAVGLEKLIEEWEG